MRISQMTTPPAALVPDELAPLITEHQSLRRRYSEAQATRARLSPSHDSTTGSLGDQARRADAAAQIAATRRGETLEHPNANVDALTKEREDNEREQDAIAAASVTVEREIRAWVTAHADEMRETLAPLVTEAHDQWDTFETTMHARLAQLRQEYGQIHGLRSWLEDVTSDRVSAPQYAHHVTRREREWTDGNSRRTTETVSGF